VTERGGDAFSRRRPAVFRIQEDAAMSLGESIALIILGAVLRFLLTWKPRHVSLPAAGVVYISFQEIGVILMIGGAASVLVWIALLVNHAAR
jgi:hypothetical protein